jgi:hypothetical protein
MNQIRPWLYIGKYRETLDYRLLRSRNITAMLFLAELVEHDGITPIYLEVEDGEPLPIDKLQKGVDFVKEQKQQGKNILIACGAGISRSATYAIATLKEIESLSLVEAFHEVKKAHPHAMPHMALWGSLCQYYNETIPWVEIAFSGNQS